MLILKIPLTPFSFSPTRCGNQLVYLRGGRFPHCHRDRPRASHLGTVRATVGGTMGATMEQASGGRSLHKPALIRWAVAYSSAG